MDDNLATSGAISGCCPHCNQKIGLLVSRSTPHATCPDCNGPLWFLRKQAGDMAVVTFLPIDPSGLRSGMRAGDAIEAVQQSTQVVLDLSRVPVIQSLLLGVLVAMRRQLEDSGRAVRLVGLSHQARETFQATQLHKLFAICADEQAALQSFEAGGT